MWYDSLRGMAKLYAKKIDNGERTLDSVPERWRKQIEEVIPDELR